MNQQIFICGCEKDGKIKKASIEKLKKMLEDNNLGYTYVEDLCGTILKNPADLKNLYNSQHSIVFGCQPRAMQNLVTRGTKGGMAEQHDYHHVDDENTEGIISKLQSEKRSPITIRYSDSWKPWYPVIDYDRCTGCLKCLNFCLFSVYSVEEDGTIVVSEAANCKDMCPACARVCPENAIIFPKHTEGGIDGSDGEFEKLEGDNLMEQIQNQDVYSVLSARRSNFKSSLLKKEQFKLAEEERRACCSGADAKSETKNNKCECDCNCDGNCDCNGNCNCDCKEDSTGKSSCC